jgi:hypothetical protein
MEMRPEIKLILLSTVSNKHRSTKTYPVVWEAGREMGNTCNMRSAWRVPISSERYIVKTH